MSIANPIKWFHSGMEGAPSMANAFGDMVGVLDACLVNGFNLKTITAITQTGGIATATIGAGHLYVPDQIVRISGATQADYNGDQRILTVDASHITFAVPSGTVSPATTGSSITCKTSPLGFDIAFTATNKRAYRSANASSPKPYLRVDNATHGSWVSGRQITGKVSMAKSMTDIDTPVTADGMAPYRSDATNYPDWGWYTWAQSQANGNSTNTLNNGAAATPWLLIGDDRAFYFLTAQTAGSYTARRLYGFGDLETFKSTDSYSAFLWASDNYNSLGAGSDQVSSFGPQCATFSTEQSDGGRGQLLLRGYTGVGNPVSVNKITLGTASVIDFLSGYSTGVPWPNGPDFSLMVHPSYAQEAGGHIRGFFPGAYAVHNNVSTNLGDLTVLDNVTGYAGRKFLAVSMAYRAASSVSLPRMLFDLTGPWR